MSEKRSRNKKKFKKDKDNIDSMVESDEHVGFIVGYTSNGVPFGLTQEELNKFRD